MQLFRIIIFIGACILFTAPQYTMAANLKNAPSISTPEKGALKKNTLKSSEKERLFINGAEVHMAVKSTVLPSVREVKTGDELEEETLGGDKIPALSPVELNAIISPTPTAQAGVEGKSTPIAKIAPKPTAKVVPKSTSSSPPAPTATIEPKPTPKPKSKPKPPVKQKKTAKRTSPQMVCEGISASMVENKLILTVQYNEFIDSVRTFSLDDPQRFVIDLKGAWKYEGAKKIQLHEGAVEYVAIGLHADKLRFVLHFRDAVKHVDSPFIGLEEGKNVIVVPLEM